MVVEWANHTKPENLNNIVGLFVAWRIKFAIFANSRFLIVPSAISTVHTIPMLLASLVAGTVLAQQNPLREITFSNSVFTIKGPEGNSQVSTLPQFQAMNTTTGQLWLPMDKYVLTFNEKGFGFRRDNKVTYADYSYIPLVPDFSPTEQIEFTKREVANKRRSLSVSAISGWEKIGSHVYVLMRWDDKSGRSWLEALVDIDFSGKAPMARLVGGFDGMSTAKGRVNDKLISENGKLYIVVNGESKATLCTYDPAKGEFSSKEISSYYTDSKLIEGSLYGMGFELTPAKTLLVNLIDREQGNSRTVAEVRGSIYGLYAPAILHYGNSNRKVLLNLTSGAEMVVPSGCGLQAVDAGILLWTPKEKPTAAALYSAGSFRTLARWVKP